MFRRPRIKWQAGLTIILQMTLITAIFFITGNEVAAQSSSCGVGTKVVFEDGQRGIGTIQEIGTESPHIGWYRISFIWAPKGEWYSPKDWGILIEGTKTKCGQTDTSSKQPPKTANNSSSAQNTGPILPEINGCPFDVPPGKVTKTSTASAQLFKRIIYEKAAAKINPESITAPKRVGIIFLKFQMEAPYKNDLSSSRFGDKRRHTGAPVGTMIYPLKTIEVLCELHGDKVRRTVTEENHSCFKNRDGDWVCPGRITKYVESKLIPVE